MPARDLDRFEALLDLLDELREANLDAPVLAEGPRDLATLAALGLPGDLVAVNQGKGRSLHDVCEDLARGGRTVILLTDWDRKGGFLAAEATRIVEAAGGRVDSTFRDRLRAHVEEPINDVEALFGYVARGLDLHFHETVEEHVRKAMRHRHPRT